MNTEEHEDQEMFDIYVEIPKIFHSVYSDGPFGQCLICTKPLLDEDVDYFIEKIYRGTEVIMESAICVQCAEQLHSELSRESCQRIGKFLQDRIDWQKRALELMTCSDEGIDSWIDKCMVTGTARSETHSYQICAKCRGDKIERTIMPFMVSGKVAEDISELLSKKTRETLDDFTEKHFGLDPEFKDIFDPGPLLLI